MTKNKLIAFIRELVADHPTYLAREAEAIDFLEGIDLSANEAARLLSNLIAHPPMSLSGESLPEDELRIRLCQVVIDATRRDDRVILQLADGPECAGCPFIGSGVACRRPENVPPCSSTTHWTVMS